MQSTQQATAHDPTPQAKWLHYSSLATLWLTFLLVFVGGSVTSHDAGMAYPDAPLSNGRLVNPPGWLNEVKTRWEHGHRLVGWVVGLTALAGVAVAFAVERRRWMRYVSIAALFAITAQGIMGIYRVKHDSVALAMMHGVWGQLTFALLACQALFSSAGWRYKLAVLDHAAAGSMRRWSLMVVGALLVQLSLGAGTRHFGSFGVLIFHIWWGVTTAVLIGRLVLLILGEATGNTWTQRAAVLLGGLTALQLALGLMAFVITGGSSSRVLSPTFIQWFFPTLHVVTGSMVLACSSLVCALCHRTMRASPTQGAEQELLAARC
ncbi:MAG: COX15/CtaA family protein [Phycisphaerales bacterium]|nr:COX15/CtaA family protein [Phycisphaerales bacterium]